MRKKTLTADCVNCKLLKVSDENQFLCMWGKNEKIMVQQKGKKTISCRLKR